MKAQPDNTAQRSMLIVDDHNILRHALRSYLCDAFPRCEIDDAANGLDALAACNSSPPDLAILDIHLPDSDGITLTSRLRFLYPAMRVIVISYGAEAIYTRRALAAGACAFVCKEHILTKLIPAVASALSDHGS